MKITIAATILMCGAFIVGCGSRAAPQLTDQDESAIREVFESALTSVRAGDWDAWAALFSDDVQYQPADAPAIRGRDAARQWAESLGPVEAIDFQDVRIAGGGNLAYATSGYTTTVQGSEDVGKQLVVLARDSNGAWKVVALSWNSNLPPPAAVTPNAAPGD